MRRRSRAVGLTAGALAWLILAALCARPLPAAAAGRPAEAAACKFRVPGRPPSPGQEADLAGVAVLSACNVWVVGSSARGSLIEHWNGRGWQVLASPGPPSGDFSAVSAVSPASIWAVGSYADGGVTKALIAHWDGTRWRQAATPPLTGKYTILTGVQAVSNHDVWAVGIAQDKALILRWNGTFWARAVYPSPGILSELDGVSATAAADVWAVGSYTTATTQRSLILHWNGTCWARVGYQGPGISSELDGVSATTAAGVWAVGSYTTATTQRSLILHWAGAKWVSVPGPHPGSGSELLGVSVMSPLRAWAVGDYSGQQLNPFAVRWNGTSWRQVPTPPLRPPGYNSILAGVAAVCGHDVWAVGTDLEPVALHWNGSAWQTLEANVPGTYNNVAADRADDAWAVGNYVNGSHNQALAVRLR